MKPLFTENQRFNQWWLWLLLAASLTVPAILLFKDATEKSSGFSGIIIILSVFLLFVVLRMRTVVTKDAIQLTYVPFVNKTIKLSDIATMKVINYGFVGGWGIRFWTSYGTVYNVRGNKGLHIKLKNGKQLVIGTQKQQELEKVIDQLNTK